jgi:hypothetical protein
MRGAEPGPDHEAATRIFTVGWRQGSVIRAADVPDLPVEGIEPDDWLVVCTQSCSVVNPRFNADTVVEWIVGRPVQELTSKAPSGPNRSEKGLALPVSLRYLSRNGWRGTGGYRQVQA